MRGNATWLLVAIIAALGIWSLAGCREQPSGDTETETVAHEHDTPSEHAEVEHAHPVEPEVASSHLERDYSTTDVERLSGVLTSGSEELRSQALEILKELLAHHRNVDTREIAARTLAAAANQAAEELVEAARTDGAPEVRCAAVEALGQATPSSWIYRQLSRLRDADDAEVRAGAFRAEMEVRLKDPDTESAMRWLGDQLGRRKDDVSAQAAITMKLRGTAMLPLAIELLETSSDPVQREVAACLIGLLCAGTNPRQQEFAKLAKAEVKDVIAKPQPANLDGLKPLEKALSEDPAAEVRAVAAQGLGYLGQPGSARALGKALHDPAEPVRWWAALALVTVPGDSAVEDIAYAATQDESEPVRRAAVQALGWIEDKEAVVPALVSAVGDDCVEVRQAAATELGRIADPAALDPLTKLFDDESEEVRWAAVVAAGQLRDPAAAPALAKALRDPSPMVANAAERALQKMGIAERRFGTRDEM